MKTFEELKDELLEYNAGRIKPMSVILKEAAKLYAKQWIDKAADISLSVYGHNFEILKLKEEIDHQ